MKYFIYTVYCIFVSGILSGCGKQEMTESEIDYYYNINKTNCLTKLHSISQSANNLKSSSSESLFNIVHISDSHVTSWSSNNHIPIPSNLLEAVWFANDPKVSINAMVETGDHIGNKEETTREEALRFLDAFAYTLYNNNQIPTFTATGNHDANMMHPHHRNFALSKGDIYNRLTTKTNYPIHSNGIENYYYADVRNPSGGFIRFIALDVIEQEGTEYNAQQYAVFSQKQISWLCETALKENMTKDHSIIVLTHYPMPSSNERIQSFVSNNTIYNWASITEVIEAFRAKRSLAKKYRNRVVETDTLSINTSFENTPGEFICYLGGHAHTYLSYEVEGYQNADAALPKQIMILANNMSPSDRNKNSHIERYTQGLRNNTFNIYAIDTQAKQIHITFFGATSFHHPEVITLKYGNGG